MKETVFYKIIYNYFYFFWQLCKRKIDPLLIPANKIQGGKFYAVHVIPCLRQNATHITKSLHRPVARNGIKQFASEERQERRRNKNDLSNTNLKKIKTEMKLQKFSLVTLLALLMVWFSCTNDLNNFQEIGQSLPNDTVWVRWDWDGKQQEKFRPTDPGTKSSWYAIDRNIISFAVPNLIGTIVYESPPIPGYGPDGYSPHLWVSTLIMAEGTDVTKLAPIITLASGATITWIHTSNLLVPSQKVDYTGIVKVGVHDFSHQVDFVVIAPDGSTVTYVFVAAATGAWGPCVNCH